MRHPDIYPYISDDTCPEREKFFIPDEVSADFLLCYNDSYYCGLFFLIEKSADEVEIHTCMLPESKGNATEFGMMAVSDIFNKTRRQKISTFIPISNKLAERLAIKCGFRFVGLCHPCLINGNAIEVKRYEVERCQEH